MAAAPPLALRRLSSAADTLAPQSPSTPSTPTALKALNPLSSKVTSVLSTSYADAEFRDALSLLDERAAKDPAETRRRLRLDLQKEIIDSNADIIDEFGRVSDVRLLPAPHFAPPCL